MPLRKEDLRVECVADRPTKKAAWLRMKPTDIYISAEAWEDLQRALKEPPKANERMRRLLSEPSVFERE